MLVFGGVNLFCLIEGFPNKKHIQLTIHIPWLLWFTCNWPRPVCSIVEIGAKAWGWNSSHWEWRLEWCPYSGEGFGLKFWSDMVQIFSCSSCSILISWFWWFFETHPVVAGMLSFFFFEDAVGVAHHTCLTTRSCRWSALDGQYLINQPRDGQNML